MSDRKRPFESNDTSSNKKLKSDVSSDASTSAPAALTGAALIAQKRAEIAAKLAAMKPGTLGAKSSSSAVISSGPTSATPAAAPSNPSVAELARRVADAKRRVGEATSKAAASGSNGNPFKSASATPTTTRPSSRAANGASDSPNYGTGLKVAAHPALLDMTPAAPQSKKDRYKPMAPKFASIKANARNAPTPTPTAAAAPIPVAAPSANPYLAAAASAAKDKEESGFEGTPRERMGRQMRFNQKGKYVAQGNQMRQEAQLEALKQRIAASATKVGLDADLGIERTIKRAPPPDVEWWDASLLPTHSYDDLEVGFQNLNIYNQDSPITFYVQHPIPIPAPGARDNITLNPMMLTTKEQKKMRKLKRQSEQQDKRDRIRMGLLPPDAPKVRLANLMRVLTSDAVQDPTRVEAKVRREVAMRKHGHDKMNNERKLTDDQRRDKVEDKKINEEKKGLHGAVFKVKKLTDPLHQNKVRLNAQQLNLTGCCIFNPNFSMVYVEGAAKYIRFFKRLMMHRINWTEPGPTRGGPDVEIDRGEDVAGPSGQPAASAKDAEVVSLEDNKCWLVWEGQLRDRSFKVFRVKSCPTDQLAKDLLGDMMRGYWDQAKNWKGEEETFF